MINNRQIPGTILYYNEHPEGIKAFVESTLSATGGLTLSQVAAITGLENSTIQNWIKRQWVANPVGKKYHERQFARILLINALRDSMSLERIVTLLAYVNGLVEDASDDLIRELTLYGWLCDAIRNLDTEQGFSKLLAEKTAERLTAGYCGPTADSCNIVTAALTVMIYACVSGLLKKEAEQLFDSIIK